MVDNPAAHRQARAAVVATLQHPTHELILEAATAISRDDWGDARSEYELIEVDRDTVEACERITSNDGSGSREQRPTDITALTQWLQAEAERINEMRGRQTWTVIEWLASAHAFSTRVHMVVSASGRSVHVHAPRAARPGWICPARKTYYRCCCFPV